jgi:hypothetical protein
LYNHVGQKEAIQKLETMIAEFGKLGVSGLCKLNNLNKEQNEKLFNTNHFHEMIYNMLLGLRKCF